MSNPGAPEPWPPIGRNAGLSLAEYPTCATCARVWLPALQSQAATDAGATDSARAHHHHPAAAAADVLPALPRSDALHQHRHTPSPRRVSQRQPSDRQRSSARPNRRSATSKRDLRTQIRPTANNPLRTEHGRARPSNFSPPPASTARQKATKGFSYINVNPLRHRACSTKDRA